MAKTMNDSSMWFSANYRGRCAVCLMTFEPEEMIRRHPDDERQYIGSTCCGDTDHTPSMGADFDYANRGRAPGVSVMPRGKTAKDRCDVCFQIPASNNVCGCDK